MMKHAWDGYVQYAWGSQELRPVTRQAHKSSLFGSLNTGLTIVDSLSTLYIMGLKEEFQRGRDWVDQNLQFAGTRVKYDIQINLYKDAK